MTSTNCSTGLQIKSIRYEITGSRGARYTVTVDPVDSVMRCDCPDATYRRRQCKHQRAVIAGAAGKPIVRVQQRPVRTPARRPQIDAAWDEITTTMAVLDGRR